MHRQVSKKPKKQDRERIITVVRNFANDISKVRRQIKQSRKDLIENLSRDLDTQ